MSRALRIFWFKLKQVFRNEYYCDCHDRSHGPPPNWLGLAGAYIGVAIGLGLGKQDKQETMKNEL